MTRAPLTALALALGLSLPPAAAQELAGTLAKVKASGRITLGIRDSSPPFSYLDDKQKVVGFAVDICMTIVDAVKAKLSMPGLAVETLPVISSSRIPLMINGTIDLECGTTTNNADRQKQVGFTNAHFLTATRMASKKTARITTVDDLKGKPVASVAGSTNVAQLIKVNAERSLGMTIMSAKDVVEGFLLVETDRAVAFVMDDIQLAVLVAQAKDPSLYTISDATLSLPEPYGIMLRRNDPSFKELADRATADLFRSPAIQTVYDRWFTQPIPPRGLNLAFPMPASMRRAFATPTDSPDPAAYAN